MARYVTINTPPLPLIARDNSSNFAFRRVGVQEAQESMAKAKTLMKSRMPKTEKGERLSGDDEWGDWLCCHILFREAEALLGNGQP